ncbi:MAG: RNA 3'-terminal phosphate cyclase [Pseudomonadota bacterium]
MIIIDGSKGEGGGQILRTALSLSACTGQPFRIKNIRSKRSKSGLLRQHLTCVKATAEICQGRASGVELGSTELTFVPGDIRRGDYRFDIGTAGATGLVFQTVLPLLLQADGSTSVQLGGGTHNKSAPPFEFLNESFFPLLRAIGANVSAELQQRGFYPAGGGMWTAFVDPLEAPQRVELSERGQVRSLSAEAATANLSGEIAERELATIKEEMGLSDADLHQRQYPASGPGNIVLIRIATASHTEVFAGFGEHRVSAERVARRAVRQAKRYLQSDVAVSEHLADQLLLPLACGAGGSFTTTEPAGHFWSNKEVIEAFLDLNINAIAEGDDHWRVDVSR